MAITYGHTDIQTYIHTDRQTELKYDIDGIKLIVGWIVNRAKLKRYDVK